VKKIGQKAFFGCKSLKKIKIQTKKLKKKTIGAQAFKGIHKKAVFKLPSNKKKTYMKILLQRGATKKMSFK
ncbi:MAG: leucine-rich repeat protein, partial [Lachnospiraceae bacterium]|nr:leucine-rich repeat protein [Lachnospiraceae bacterium]